MIAGMLMYDPDIEIHFVLITVTALLLIPASHRIGKTNGPILLRMRSLPLLLLFFCTGHHLMFLHDEQADPYWLGHKPQHGSDWLAWVTAPTRTTKSGYQAELQVIAHRTSSSWQPVSGGIWASYRGPKLQEGDTILLFRTPGLVPSALRDTNGFWAHLGHRNIHHRVWLREGDWQLVAPAQDHRPSFMARSVIKGGPGLAFQGQHGQGYGRRFAHWGKNPTRPGTETGLYPDGRDPRDRHLGNAPCVDLCGCLPESCVSCAKGGANGSIS
jgi:hypothetical protein